MDQIVDLSISRTQTRRNNSILSSFYTVRYNQIYEIKIVIDDSFVYLLFKRYKEIRLFHNEIKNLLGENYIFPKFPPRTLNSMSPKVINERKIKLEKWLQHALTSKSLDAVLKEFLEIPLDFLSKPSSRERLNEDEILIKEFNRKIFSSPHCKINIIDEFEKQFFSRRRNLSGYFIKLLMRTLAPLCSDDFVGSKALYALYELCNRVNFFDFELSIKELAKLDVDVLAQIRLNDYLLKKRFVDSQIQAFHILNQLKVYFSDETLIEILNGDLEAFNLFVNWDGKNCISSPKSNIVPVSDWRNLYDSQNGLSLSYRFLNKELHILAKFQIMSEIYTLADLVITPNKRKLWDVNLIEMEKIDTIDENRYFRLVYLHERSLYEFHNSVSIDSKDSKTTILFESKNLPISIKGELGSLNSHYKFKKISRNECLSPRKNHTLKGSCSTSDHLLKHLEKQRSLIKVTWKVSFCENSRKLLISDCFEETDLMKKTFSKFLDVIENKPLEPSDSDQISSISQACDRKKLKKTFISKQYSSVEGFKDYELL